MRGRRKVNVRVKKTRLAIVGLECGRDYELRNVGKCLKTGEVKRLDSPLQPPEKNAALVTLILSQ